MNQRMIGRLLLFSIFGLFTCSKQPLPTVDQVDLERYAGKWYEIASFPMCFQRGCTCTTAEYTPTGQGYVEVLNRCIKNGEPTSAEGKAFPVKGSNNSRLRVQFFWPFRGNYYVIALADDYSYAMVGSPNRKYLWILSRSPQLDPDTLQMLKDKAENLGFDINRLQRTEQEECER